MISQTGFYALQAVLRLARNGGARASASALAAQLDIPGNYLSKVLQRLARDGMLDSLRGPGGGYCLTAPPEALTVAEVVEPFRNVTDRSTCLMGGPCNPDRPCVAHTRRVEWNDAATELLNQTTLADLLSGTPADGWESAVSPSEEVR